MPIPTLWSLLALTFIDFDTQLLPDNLTLPLLWGGLVLRDARFRALLASN